MCCKCTAIGSCRCRRRPPRVVSCCSAAALFVSQQWRGVLRDLSRSANSNARERISRTIDVMSHGANVHNDSISSTCQRNCTNCALTQFRATRHKLTVWVILHGAPHGVRRITLDGKRGCVCASAPSGRCNKFNIIAHRNLRGAARSVRIGK